MRDDTADVHAATGATELHEVLARIEAGAGRDAALALRGAVHTYVLDHPGCIYGASERRRYADAFRPRARRCARTPPYVYALCAPRSPLLAAVRLEETLRDRPPPPTVAGEVRRTSRRCGSRRSRRR